MSTPNPVLKAAAPTLITALQEFQVMINTILTGDPLTAPARVVPAAEILVGQLQLLLPGLAASEVGVANTAIDVKIGTLITQLQALK
jgi:hypothetical protein